MSFVSHEGNIYVLKDIIPGNFKYITSLQKLVDDSPNIRTFLDSIPDRNILVYLYREQSLFAPNVQSLPPCPQENSSQGCSWPAWPTYTTEASTTRVGFCMLPCI